MHGQVMIGEIVSTKLLLQVNKSFSHHGYMVAIIMGFRLATLTLQLT